MQILLEFEKTNNLTFLRVAMFIYRHDLTHLVVSF